MSCDRFIYKVSWFSSRKHVNSWRDEYFMTEEQTRFIYDKEPYGDVRIFVIKVCVNSEIYKKVKRPEVEEEEVEAEEEVVPPAPPSSPKQNINMVIDAGNNDLWSRDENGRRIRDDDRGWGNYKR